MTATWLLAACDPGVATQVLLEVDADEATRARAESVEITVVPVDGEPIIRLEPLVGASARLGFPFTQPLSPRGGDASRRFRVNVALRDASGAEFLRHTVLGGFVEAERREVRVELTADCHERSCSGDQTCVAGECLPACVQPTPEGASVLVTPVVSCATWSKRMTIAAGTARADQPGFPLLVALNDAELAELATVDGRDIGFVDPEGGLLPHELVVYDQGRLVAWVRLPVLREASDTQLQMTFGRGEILSRPQEVWAGHELVFHLDEARAPALDVSPNQLASRPSGVTAGEPAVVGSGYRFDGDDKLLVDLPDDEVATFGREDGFSVSAWVRVDTQRDFAPILFRGGRNGPGYVLQLDRPGRRVAAYMQGRDSPRIEAGGVDLTVGEWAQVVMVADRQADELRLFVDGERAGAVGDLGDLAPLAGPDNDFVSIGATGGCCEIEGALDEVWLVRGAHSDERVRLLHRNQREPASFFTVGPLEAL